MEKSRKLGSSMIKISKLIVKWCFGILCLIVGLMGIFTISIIGGLLIIIGGLFVLPPIIRVIEEKTGKPLLKIIKYLVVFVTVIIGLYLIGTKQKQIEFDKLPQNVKDSINLSNVLAKAKQDSIVLCQKKVKQANELMATQQKQREKAKKDSLKEIQKKLEQEIEFKSKQQEMREEYAKDRERKVKKQFDPWEGSHIKLTKYIKEHMNDKDSWEHIETKFGDHGDYILVVTKFRGANKFGGKVINTVTAKVDIDGEIIEIVSYE